jgi:hypothetical protein
MVDREGLRAILGPLGASRSQSYWYLLLWPDRVVAWPYTVAESFWLELSRQVFFIPGPRNPILSENPSEFAHALERATVRTYLRGEISSLTLRHRVLRNGIEIWRTGGSCDRYFIQFRSLTAACGDAFRMAYPDLYRETGVPTSLVGRLLKR